MADITYVATLEGWLYLAAVLDLCIRKVVGWSMLERIDSRLVVDALEMAVSRELPVSSNGSVAGLIAHSDRGVQYASEHYQGVLTQHEIECRLSRCANCWDNAPAESFFATLKKGLVHHESYATRAEAGHHDMHRKTAWGVYEWTIKLPSPVTSVVRPQLSWIGNAGSESWRRSNKMAVGASTSSMPSSEALL